ARARRVATSVPHVPRDHHGARRHPGTRRRAPVRPRDQAGRVRSIHALLPGGGERVSPDTWQHLAPVFWFGVLMFGVATAWIASAARRGLEEVRDAARDRHP